MGADGPMYALMGVMCVVVLSLAALGWSDISRKADARDQCIERGMQWFEGHCLK